MLIRALASIFSFSYFWSFCFLFLFPAVEPHVIPAFGAFGAFFALQVLLFVSLCCTLPAKSDSQTMFSAGSASVQSTKQGLLPRFSQDQVGNCLFSFFIAFQNVRFLFENTTLGPPKQSLAFSAWCFFPEPKLQGVTLELKKYKLKCQLGECDFSSFSSSLCDIDSARRFPCNVCFGEHLWARNRQTNK